MTNFLIGCCMGFLMLVAGIVTYAIVSHQTTYIVSKWFLLVIPLTGILFKEWVQL